MNPPLPPVDYSQPALFIGGAADGKRSVTAGYPVFRVPVLHEPKSLRDTGDMFSTSFETETYNLEFLASPDKVHLLYVHDSLNTSQAIERLLTHYRP